MSIFNKKITKNFTWKEFFHSDLAKKHKISNNTTNIFFLENAIRLFENLAQPIRDEFGPIRILSGFRSGQLNRLIYNKYKYSNHLVCQSVDIEPVDTSISLLEIGKFIEKNLEFRELIFEYLPVGWLHITYRKNRNTRKIKLKDSRTDYKTMTIDEVEKYIYKI